jgi:multidrug efflux system membrane fusion protein
MWFCMCLPMFRSLTLLLALLFIGCGQKPNSAQQPPKNVLVTTVRRMDVPVQINQFGRVSSLETVNIKPQVAGRITEVHFQEGQEVKKGDLLFVIDPRPFQADLEQAQGQLKSDSAQVDVNRKNLQRDLTIGRQRFVSEQEIDNLRAQVANFEGAAEKDQAAIDRANLNLEYCYVKSPVDGRTGRRLVDPGNYVGVGSEVLVNIQRLDRVYVDFSISENDLAQLRENMEGNSLKVDVDQPAKPDAVRSGSLTFLDNAVSSSAGSVLLRATIPNEDRYLWPGQYVNVALTVQVLKDALVVPNQTVQISKNGPYLFTVNSDNTVDLRLVKPGVRYRDLIVVNEGVKPDETVVVEGQLALAKGMKVNAQQYQPPKPEGRTLGDNSSQGSSAGSAKGAETTRKD